MKVLIADSNSAIRYGLTVLIEEQEDIEIIGEAVDFNELIQRILERCPDLILLSWELLGLGGKNLMQTVRLICPDVHVVVMSSQTKAADLALSAGADNFISKAEPPERLLAVIRGYIGLQRGWQKL